MHPARSNPLRSSEKIAARGQGTWHLAESLARWAQEVASSRLGVDYIDLHVLHWRGRVPLVETIDGFDELELDGIIRDWGVSNPAQIAVAPAGRVRPGLRPCSSLRRTDSPRVGPPQ
jgi:aryl-alcohol dehydrogenase-like predicted oxidoreductase